MKINAQIYIGTVGSKAETLHNYIIYTDERALKIAI